METDSGLLLVDAIANQEVANTDCCSFHPFVLTWKWKQIREKSLDFANTVTEMLFPVQYRNSFFPTKGQHQRNGTLAFANAQFLGKVLAVAITNNHINLVVDVCLWIKKNLSSFAKNKVMQAMWTSFVDANTISQFADFISGKKSITLALSKQNVKVLQSVCLLPQMSEFTANVFITLIRRNRLDLVHVIQQKLFAVDVNNMKIVTAALEHKDPLHPTVADIWSEALCYGTAKYDIFCIAASTLRGAALVFFLTKHLPNLYYLKYWDTNTLYTPTIRPPYKPGLKKAILFYHVCVGGNLELVEKTYHALLPFSIKKYWSKLAPLRSTKEITNDNVMIWLNQKLTVTAPPQGSNHDTYMHEDWKIVLQGLDSKDKRRETLLDLADLSHTSLITMVQNNIHIWWESGLSICLEPATETETID